LGLAIPQLLPQGLSAIAVRQQGADARHHDFVQELNVARRNAQFRLRAEPLRRSIFD
jgi:hypothetical protein